MLPGIDGLEVCRRLRETSEVPVIMLTALGEEQDRVVGLEIGADDYVTKPFSPRELVLRVDSVLRRAGDPAADVPAVLVDGDLAVDHVRRTVTLAGRPLALTVREFDLLRFLLAHPDKAWSREELLREVWGWTIGDQSTVTVHVRRLREKVETDPTTPVRLVTVWGVGYRWESTMNADQFEILVTAALAALRRRRARARRGLPAAAAVVALAAGAGGGRGGARGAGRGAGDLAADVHLGPRPRGRHRS